MSVFGTHCLHRTYSAPDELGEAICFECGARVSVVLTPASISRAAETVRRGRHSRLCVDTPHGWVCATDCTMQ